MATLSQSSSPFELLQKGEGIDGFLQCGGNLGRVSLCELLDCVRIKARGAGGRPLDAEFVARISAKCPVDFPGLAAAGPGIAGRETLHADGMDDSLFRFLSQPILRTFQATFLRSRRASLGHEKRGAGKLRLVFELVFGIGKARDGKGRASSIVTDSVLAVAVVIRNPPTFLCLLLHAMNEHGGILELKDAIRAGESLQRDVTISRNCQ